MNFAKVTVIIPNYNHARYLSQRIDSVLQQTYQNLEVLLLDDCSQDGSREILEHYAVLDERIQLLFNERNSGSTFKQWNKGIAHATGKYVWIAESDDYADPTLLETLVTVLEADAQIGLAYSSSWYVDENSQLLHTDREFFSSLDPLLWTNDFVVDGLSMITRFMFNRNIIPNASAVVLRRSVLEQVGPADITKKINGDWLYWARILSVSKLAYIAKSLNYFRQHNNNVRSAVSISGIDLEETTALLLSMRQYGEPEQTLYQVMINYLYYRWFNSMAYSKIPVKRHYAIYKNMVQLDSGLKKRFLTFLFSNKMSGLRTILGDGLVYPLFNTNKKHS